MDGEITFILREVCPADFYWFSLVENDYPNIDANLFIVLILTMLTDMDEDNEEVLLQINRRYLGASTWWVTENLLKEKVMKVENWLELAFHLCKQRWDESIEWMETQPISKILLMTQIQSKFNQDQEREMKKGSKK